MSGDVLTTAEMLMALEEMPAHTLYRALIPELYSYQAEATVYRCDCLSGGAYVIDTDRLSPHYGVPCFWTRRDDFLLDLGYRGVNGDTVWQAVPGANVPCDNPVIAGTFSEMREGLRDER
jgi:hypothetical protein